MTVSESLNVVIADEFRLFRRGLVSLVNQMDIPLPSNIKCNIVADVSTPGDLVSALSNKRVDLLLMGYSLNTVDSKNHPLSSMDGNRLVKWLLYKYPGLKIIVLSNFKHSSIIRMSLESGAMGYISKDISEKTLERSITSVLNNEVYVEKKLMQSLFCHKIKLPTEITLKENEVLRLLCKGLPLRNIASRMNLSIKTVSAHKIRVMDKLEVSSDSQLYFLLSKLGLYDVEI